MSRGYNWGATVSGFALYDCQRMLSGAADHPDASRLDALVVAELAKHRADAERSPEAIRRSNLGTPGPKSQAWRVL